MKSKLSGPLFKVMALGLLLVAAGCQTCEKFSLTCRLWETGEWRKFNEPAPNPNLALFEAHDRSDVLVQYDALSERHSSVARQAYYLEQSGTLVAGGKKPKLVKALGERMKPIPVLAEGVVASNLPPEYAIVIKQGRAFTLYRPSEREGDFDLPVYPETSGATTRIVLTPLAVAGDTVMIGVFGIFLWLYLGAPGANQI